MKNSLSMYLWHKLGLLKLSLLLVIFSSQNAILSAVSEIDTTADRAELDRVFLADLLGGTAALTTDSGSVATLSPTDAVTTTALTLPAKAVTTAVASMLVQSQPAKLR